MNRDKNPINYNNGIIDGVIYCEDEERRLTHGKRQKSHNKFEDMFRFPDLNE